jgi:TfoX/Sxy family transcriptional regulator of competence genes
MAQRAMPSFSKSPPDLIEKFAAVMERYPDAVRRKMFGYPAAFVGGNMATGLFADQWVVRLPDDQIQPAKAAGAAPFEPMPGKAMKAFVVIPAADVADDEALRGWVERGLAHAASMPAKK